jgi:O-antigen/teichoic acid export membrane protein
MAMATVVAVLANILLIPRFGAHGAAWATVASELVLLAGTYWGVQKFNRPQRAA